MGITTAVTRVACNTATGNQDITTADLGGLTPKAAFFTVTRAVTDGTPANHAILGFGAATATDEQWACVVRSENAQGTTDAYRRGATDECVMILNTTATTVDGEATFVTFITNGIRINWGNAPSAGFFLTVRLYAGTDLSAQALHFAVASTQDATVDVNTIGFEPDVLLTAHINYSLDDTPQTQALLSHGIVTNTSPIVQLAWGIRYKYGQATSASLAHFYDHYGATVVNYSSGAALLGYEFGTFDAQGVSCTTRLGTGVGDIACLALAFGGAVSFKAGIIDSPTANGNQSITDPAFKPQYVHVGVTQLQAVDTGYSTGLAGSIGVSVFDANNAYCDSIQDEDGQGTSDTQSQSDDTVINLPDDDGTVGWVASFVSLDASGWTWNFTQSHGTAVKWWYWAIEEETVAATAALPIISGEGIHSLVFGGVTVR